MRRIDKEDAVPVAILIVSLGIFLWIAFWLLSGNAYAATSEPASTFDHSNCQYPNRASNPVDGCDNSDPAVPECVSPKILDEQACIAEYTARYSQKDESEPISDIKTPPAASQAVNCTES